jgi:hypothetical protein
MTPDPQSSVREKTKEVLLGLTQQEGALLSRILKLERDFLHQKRPRIKDELLRAVREVVKEIPR